MNCFEHFARFVRYCTQCGQEAISRDDGHYECAQGHDNYVNPAPAVGVAVMRGDSILLAQRAREPKKGHWDLVGGFMEPGESGLEAIGRELEEETGMALKAAELVDVLPGDYDGQPTINLLYIGQAEGEPVANDDVADLQWYPLDALPTDLAWPHEASMLEHIATMVQQLRDTPEAP